MDIDFRVFCEHGLSDDTMPRPTTLYAFAAIAFIALVYTLLPSHGSQSRDASLYPPSHHSAQDEPSTDWTDSNVHDKPIVDWTGSTTTQTHSNSKETPTASTPPVDHGYKPSTSTSAPGGDEDAIARLMREADLRFSSLLGSQSTTLEEAAERYRKRRGRHPPPGFDLWFKYAQDNDAIVVEEFWDQVYHDIEPFWAVDPALIRAQARDLGMAVMIKEGHAEVYTDWFWHVIWRKMIDEIAFMLPNMVIPFNTMDEPRMMVPYVNISELVSIADDEKDMLAPQDVLRKMAGWGEAVEPNAPALPFVEWHLTPPYSFAREACSPSTPIHGDYKLHNSGKASLETSTSNWMLGHQFVENSTAWSDTCQDPAIAAYHAALISPISGRTSQTLQPLFGGSKFSVNNDILVPAPMYWNGEERFEQDDYTPWSEKANTAIWRGTATGGRHNTFNWPHFHRHRFVALSNGTKYALHSDNEQDPIFTPAYKHAAIDRLSTPLQKNLPAFLDRHTNAAFTDLFCDVPTPEARCYYLDEEYMVALGLSLSVQYGNKYLPDIDGNSFSGRYRSFLMSSSLPMKATLYREWHDTRLIAWKHFVPMNNRFTDFYALMAYFAGCEADICGEEIPSHDSDAEAIAIAGSEWAKKVLRKVDMQIYVARVLLEYARVTDDDRAKIGWVDDLLAQQTPKTNNQGMYKAETHEEDPKEQDMYEDKAAR